MSAQRCAVPLLLGADHVVACEIGVRRAGRVLQSEGHQYRALDSGSEILDVEIAQQSEYMPVVHPKPVGLLQHFVHRPIDYVPVIFKIAHERNGRCYCLHPVVEGCGNPAKCSALAFTLADYALAVHFLATADEVYGSDGVAVRASVIEILL